MSTNKAQNLIHSDKVKPLLAALKRLGPKANNEDQISEAVEELDSLTPIEIAAVMYYGCDLPGVRHLPYICARHSEDLMFETSYYMEALFSMKQLQRVYLLKPHQLQEYVSRLEEWSESKEV